MSNFTSLSTAIWDWAPFVDSSLGERNVIWCLLTGQTVKRILPGMFHGSVQVLAEDSRAGYDDTLTALTSLCDRKVSAWDKRSRVIRLCELPDNGERAHNPNTLQGWWRRFRTVPECRVRNDHVGVLRWLSEPMTEGKQKVWSDTFATLGSEPSRSRYHAVVSEPPFQGSLFASDSSQVLGQPFRNGSAMGFETHGIGIGIGDPDLGSAPPVDNPPPPPPTPIATTAPADRSGPVTPPRLEVVRSEPEPDHAPGSLQAERVRL